MDNLVNIFNKKQADVGHNPSKSHLLKAEVVDLETSTHSC